MLVKPTKKPDFSSFKGIEVLKRAQEFMPKFISETDRLLSNPDVLREHQMDINIVDQDECTADGAASRWINTKANANHNINFVSLFA